MRKLLVYIVVMAWCFAWLDWQSIHQTRWVHRDWLEWMHTHETLYAALTTYPEALLCYPCLAVRPVLLEALKRVDASQEEQDAITHAPALSNDGFYHLVRRGESWTFVPWWAWFVVHLPPSVLWFVLARRFFR